MGDRPWWIRVRDRMMDLVGAVYCWRVGSHDWFPVECPVVCYRCSKEASDGE